MPDREEIASALRREKRTVEEITSALKLFVHPRSHLGLDMEVHRICSWMDDAISALEAENDVLERAAEKFETYPWDFTAQAAAAQLRALKHSN